MYAGLGTHYVPSGHLPALREELAKPLKRQSDKQQGLKLILERLQPFAQDVSHCLVSYIVSVCTCTHAAP